MKLNKTKPKNKGKVHPLSLVNSDDPSSNLNNLLPQTILTLISILSLQDQQVLSYLITHSLSSSTTTLNTNTKKVTHSNKKLPSFDCGCFDCYTSYWFKWDSSPHRELIHQAIDAFEEHLAFSEQQKSKSNKGSNEVKNFEASSSSSHSTPDVIEQKEESLMEMGCGDDVEERECDDVAVEKECKGFAKKVLPDVIGLFNSRLWNLWGPNV